MNQYTAGYGVTSGGVLREGNKLGKTAETFWVATQGVVSVVPGTVIETSPTAQELQYYGGNNVVLHRTTVDVDVPVKSGELAALVDASTDLQVRGNSTF